MTVMRWRKAGAAGGGRSVSGARLLRMRTLGLGAASLVAAGLGVAGLEASSGPGAAGLQQATIEREAPGLTAFRVEVPSPQIESDLTSGDVRLTVAGYGHTSETGAPELPHRSFLIGVPEGVEPTLRVRVVETRLLAGARPRPVPAYRIEDSHDDLPIQFEEPRRDEAVFASAYPRVWASLGEEGRLRHLPVVRVDVYPFRWNPVRHGIEMATVLEIEVSWDPAPARPAGREPVLVDAASWERTYAAAILNWDQARHFRTSPTGWQSAGLRPAPVGSEPEMRFDVERTGIHRVTYEDLVAAGWDVGPVPVDQLALEERGFDEQNPTDPFLHLDIPIHVADYDENGSFNEEDAIFFFALNSWDRYQPAPRIKRYGRRNAYWFLARPEGGARMEQAPSTLGRTDLASESEFLWTARTEGDGAYMDEHANVESSDPLANGILNILTEHFYWLGPQPEEYRDTFQTPGIRRPESLRAGFQGILTAPGVPQARPELSVGPVGGTLVTLPAFTVPHHGAYLYRLDASVVGSIPLAHENEVAMILPVDAYGAGLDYLEWAYHRGFGVFEDRVDFQTSSWTGARQFDLSGFSSFDILLFEVSDSLAPRLLTHTAAQHIRQDPNRTRVLRTQFDLGGVASRRVFTAVEQTGAYSPVVIERASAHDLSAPGDAGLIVIAHPSFVAGIEPLVERRRAQGWTVEVATMREVADQFDGGRSTPTAIRNYLRYLFRSRAVDPTDLLLVGDGSEDYANVTFESAPNFVPTQLVLSDAFSSGGPELVASDVWFVDNLNGTGEQLDFMFDMRVGRLPVGNQTELTDVVSKILNYENFREADQWRNRGLTMADDQFSSQISFADDYKFRGNEDVFRRAGRITEDIILRQSDFTDFAPDSFYLSCFLDTIACLDRCIPINPGDADCHDRKCPTIEGVCGTSQINRGPIDEERTRDLVTTEIRLQEKLWNKMSRGYLYVMFQSHANWGLATHEQVWRESRVINRNDSAQLTNVEKPFLFFGFGCHMAEFGSLIEAALRRGDCLAEKMLFADNGRGAVAAIASTGYEWLHANAYFQEALIRTWFLDPPVDGGGHARWLLGDLIDGGKLTLISGSNDDTRRAQAGTYVLLGDPTMPVDIAAPRLDRVEVNGQPWSIGETLTSESDSALVEVWLRDEVWIENVSVFEAGVAVDPARYTVSPDPDYRDDGRHAILRYPAPLDVPASDYTIEVRGRDRVGRTRSLALPVALTARFEALRPDGWTALRGGDFLGVGDSVRVSIASPVPREASDLDLRFEGSSLSPSAVPIAGSPNSWRLQTVISFVKGAGEQVLEVRVARRGGGEATRSVSVVGLTGSEIVQLTSVFNFPNPFSGETQFFYTLNGAARSARLQLFTMRGQRIFEAAGSARAGENRLDWDGRDSDGDEVANGVYFYKIEVETPGGKTISRIERVARIR